MRTDTSPPVVFPIFLFGEYLCVQIQVLFTLNLAHNIRRILAIWKVGTKFSTFLWTFV